jgi:murein DD-endopeptidase MepM/ murein hydrolase activator NlpD
LVACADQPRPAPISERSAVRPAGLSPNRAALPVGRYRVRPGDTLFKIAFEQGTDIQQLALKNRLNQPYMIYPGQILLLPEPLPKVVTPTPSQPGPRATGPEAEFKCTLPVRGVTLKAFDPASGMKGMDIGGVRGAPVKAAASGQVAYAGNALRGYGNLIIVQHTPAILTAYAHMSKVSVREGQYVTIGQPIGAMGDTAADRVKLHFEVREFGKPVDPRSYCLD